MDAVIEHLTLPAQGSDPGSHGGPIPSYGILDVWMAFFGTSHPEFDEFYGEHGYAETWARLLHEVRSRPALSAQEAATEIEWGVRIPGENAAYTQIFDNEWAAKEAAASDKSWCSTTPRIIETRRVTRTPWQEASNE